MVIGAVALIVIGPKDLPKALRTVGQMTGKIRRMAAEFQGQFNEAMREAELDEVKKQLQGVNDSVSSLDNTDFNPIQTIRDELKSAIEAPAGSCDNRLRTPRRSRPWSRRRSRRLRSRPTRRRRPLCSGRRRLRSDPLIELPPPRASIRPRRSPKPCGVRPNTKPQQAAARRTPSPKSQNTDAKAG